MANYGNHEQHVKAGQQSHKNTPSKDDDRNMNMGSRNNQNDSNSSRSNSSSGRSSGTQGGTHEQHVNAGRQSHKNSK